jgi:hypothetical protein
MKYQNYQYCIVNDNRVEENSIRWSQSLCIKHFIKKNPFYADWKHAYESGLRCVKVRITIERFKK